MNRAINIMLIVCIVVNTVCGALALFMNWYAWAVFNFVLALWNGLTYNSRGEL